jgi:5-methylcytosine-specific restriction enzyme A
VTRTRTNEHAHLYNSRRWKDIRRDQLEAEPLCARCQTRGVDTLATVAHHRVPHQGDEKLFFDRSNLASSCKPCHDQDEQRVERGGRPRSTTDADGWPTDIA